MAAATVSHTSSGNEDQLRMGQAAWRSGLVGASYLAEQAGLKQRVTALAYVEIKW